MMTAMRGMVVLLFIAALVIVVQETRLHGAEQRAITASLVRDSLEASHDTTRLIEVVPSSDSISSDSALVWQRRAVQAAQRADALDRALGEARMARATVQVATAGLDTAVVVPVPGTTQVIRQAPYTLAIEGSPGVRLDTAASIRLRVTTDTLTLDVRVGCGVASHLGVRPASVSVSAPTWAHVALNQVEQDPLVCNATALPGHGVVRRLIDRLGVTVGYSALVADGAVVIRPTIGVGFRVWP